MNIEDLKKTGHYNAKDCAVTLMVWDELSQNGAVPPAMQVHYMELIDPLVYMMTRGIKVDCTALEKEREDVLHKANQIREEICTLAGFDINPNSPKQLQTYFYETLGERPSTRYNKSTGSSSVSIDDKALARLAKPTSKRPGIRAASLVQDYRRLVKYASTYLNLKLDADSRMRCSYQPRGTRFARLSSSKTIFGTGMNMQNLPKEFKSFLVADDGYVFIEIDKAQAEWVVVAYEAGDPAMIEVFEENRDAHINTAQRAIRELGINVDIDELRSEHKQIGTSNDADYIKKIRLSLRGALAEALRKDIWLPRTMSSRQMGKKSNHGLNYKEGPRVFALHNEISESDAKKIVELYTRVYPKIKDYWERVRQKIISTGRLENCFEREYPFYGQFNDEMHKAGISFIPQSTVGDLVNTAIRRIYYSSSPELENFELLGQVHDSCLGQLPIPTHLNYHEACLEIAKCMVKIRELMDIETQSTSSGKPYTIRSDLSLGFVWSKMAEMPTYEKVDAIANAVKKLVTPDVYEKAKSIQLA